MRPQQPRQRHGTHLTMRRVSWRVGRDAQGSPSAEGRPESGAVTCHARAAEPAAFSAPATTPASQAPTSWA